MNNVIPIEGGPPAEIVYIPEGQHRITPTVNGKAAQITVRVDASRGPEIAAKLQGDLDRRKASNVRPWIDFGHKEGEASALPQSFHYEPGRGIVLRLEWTHAGRRAVEGKDFSYFSPVFFLGDDGTPAGLPERGPIGALVNEPAFREIPRIAATDATRGIEERAKSLVAAGDVRSLDEGIEQVMASDPGAYRTYLASLAKNPIIKATASAPLSPPVAGGIEERARQLVIAREAKDIDEAIDLVMASDPKAYETYLASLN